MSRQQRRLETGERVEHSARCKAHVTHLTVEELGWLKEELLEGIAALQSTEYVGTVGEQRKVNERLAYLERRLRDVKQQLVHLHAEAAREKELREKQAFEAWWNNGACLHPEDQRTGKGYERDKEIAFRAWYARSCQT